MSISPVVALWMNIIIGILTALTTGGLSLTGIVNAQQAQGIVTLASFVLVILNIISHAYSSPTPGPANTPKVPPNA